MIILFIIAHDVIERERADATDLDLPVTVQNASQSSQNNRPDKVDLAIKLMSK